MRSNAGFGEVRLDGRVTALGREENFESPPDSSHPASQVTTAHVDGYVQNRAAHHTSSSVTIALVQRIAPRLVASTALEPLFKGIGSSD
jgi:hypothetical protein